MKANELMIGDWVTHKGDPIQISSIGIACATGGDDDDFKMMHFLDLSPIPITPEILGKNGFVLSKKSSRKPYQLQDNSVYVSVIKGRLNARYYEKFGKPINAMQIDCNYVHELQHALRLCGIGKDIVL